MAGRVVYSDEDYVAAVQELGRFEGGSVHYKTVARALGVHPSTAWYRLRKLCFKGLLHPVLTTRYATAGGIREVNKRCAAAK